VPTSWTKAIIQLKEYQVFLMAFLGYAHPVTLAYKEGVWFLEYIYLELQPVVKREVGSKLAPGLIVYHL